MIASIFVTKAGFQTMEIRSFMLTWVNSNNQLCKTYGITSSDNGNNYDFSSYTYYDWTLDDFMSFTDRFMNVEKCHCHKKKIQPDFIIPINRHTDLLICTPWKYEYSHYSDAFIQNF